MNPQQEVNNNNIQLMVYQDRLLLESEINDSKVFWSCFCYSYISLVLMIIGAGLYRFYMKLLDSSST